MAWPSRRRWDTAAARYQARSRAVPDGSLAHPSAIRKPSSPKIAPRHSDVANFDKVKHMHWQRLLAILCLAYLASAPARASNVSDHWFSPSESGWGVSVTQQDEIAFIVFFVYDQDGRPMWLHGTGTRYGYDMERNPGFAGPLYRTTGPWFGGPFDPAAVQAVQVGTVTFEARGVDSAAIEYTVDGVKTTKTVQRLTFRQQDWSGLYFGAVRAGYRNCAPGFSPAFIYDSGFVEIDHQGGAFSLTTQGAKATCHFSGTYTQHGRIGEVQGTYACEGGPGGTFRLKGLETTERTFGARIEASHPNCSATTLDVAGTLLLSD